MTGLELLIGDATRRIFDEISEQMYRISSINLPIEQHLAVKTSVILAVLHNNIMGLARLKNRTLHETLQLWGLSNSEREEIKKALLQSAEILADKILESREIVSATQSQRNNIHFN